MGRAEKAPALLITGLVQLPAALLVCVLLPALFRWPDIDLLAAPPQIDNATLGAAGAVVSGCFFMRRFGDFPGVQSGSNILVSFTIPFAIVAVVFFAARVEFSKDIYAVSYGLSLIAFLLTHFVTGRLIQPHLHVVPGGNSDRLTRLPGVEWSVLVDPPASTDTISAVVVDLRHDHWQAWERFLTDCALAGIPVYHTKQLSESLTGKVEIEHLSENNFGSLLPSLVYLKFKQTIDFVVAVAALPLFVLVIVVVSPAIWITSGRPIFYAQERVGYRGRHFRLYKFRTMANRADGSDASQRSLAMTRNDDDRVTPLGKWLRRYRIDEAPQILNILLGDMSWIGPRPEAAVLSKWYEAELSFYRYRHVVRPGITGWAQVNQGHVADPGQVLEKLHYDFFYIKYLSPWLDLVIVLKTIRTVLSGFGAR